ncbi:hypothetical protein X773_14615 [Mesorhizobium sp. LSJC285A00]|nr:hypothetical protein X773_14615 [Mesorhizobium sp. LSJC285A00]
MPSSVSWPVQVFSAKRAFLRQVSFSSPSFASKVFAPSNEPTSPPLMS